MKRIFACFFAGCLGGSASLADAIDLKESKFTQVVNDVQIVSTSNNARRPAAVDAIFKLPDVLRTGPASRAEMVAEDRTITRVGANTIFSFDQAKRSIQLEKGSLLFNSPKGKGGGSIHTAAATAAVVGTTIIVSTTPNGGFKVLTLEGRAEVRYASGLMQRLDAGQMTFVLPGSVPGPVVMFRLDQQVGGSTLVKGFAKPLPAQDRINAAVAKQTREIASGRVEDTGLMVGDEATPTGVKVIKLFDQVSASGSTNEIAGLTPEPEVTPEKPGLPAGFVVPTRLVFDRDQGGFVPAATNGNGLLFVSSGAQGTNPPTRIEYSAGPADAALDDQTISGPFTSTEPLVFRESVDIYLGFAPSPHPPRYPSFMGFIGKNITISAPSLDLNQFAPMDHFEFLALEDLHITADLDISAANIPNGVSMEAGRRFLVDPDVSLRLDTPSAFIFSLQDPVLDRVTIQKIGPGTLFLDSSFDLTLKDTFIAGDSLQLAASGNFSATAAAPTNGGFSGSSSVHISSGGSLTIGVDVSSNADAGSISLSKNFGGGQLIITDGARLSAGTITLSSPAGVLFSGASAQAGQMTISSFFSGGSIDLQNARFDISGTMTVQNSGTGVTINNSQINVGSLFANSAQTMTLAGSQITAGQQASLSSGGVFSLADSSVSADAVSINAGSLAATRTLPNLGEITGSSSVALNASAGLNLGVNVTAGTTPSSGSINIASSSGDLAIAPSVVISANSVRLSSFSGTSIANDTISGNQVTLSAGNSFGGGPLSIRNATLTASSSLNANSFGGILFDTTAFNGGQVNLTAGSSFGASSFGGAPIQITASTFDLNRSMSVQNNTGILTVNNASRVTAAGSFTAGSPDGMAINNARISGNRIDLASGNEAADSVLEIESSTLASTGRLDVQGDFVNMNTATATATGDLTVSGGTVTMNNTTLSGQRVTIDSASSLSAPNVAPNNGQITGVSEVNLTAQNGLTVGVNVTADATAGSINMVNNSGLLAANGGKTFAAAFVNVSSAGGLLFDNTRITSGRRVDLVAGRQPGTQAVVQNTTFSGLADVNIAGHTVVLNQVAFADGSIVTLRSDQGVLAALPNTGRPVEGGRVNYVQGVTYGGVEAQLRTGPGQPISIKTLTAP